MWLSTHTKEVVRLGPRTALEVKAVELKIRIGLESRLRRRVWRSLNVGLHVLSL